METPSDGLKIVVSEDLLKDLDNKNEELKQKLEVCLSKGDIPQAIELTKKRISLVGEHLKEPHILYIMGRLALMFYYWYLYANKTKWFKSQQLPAYF